MSIDVQTGFTGAVCENGTTLNFNGGGYWKIPKTQDATTNVTTNATTTTTTTKVHSGLSISLSFATTMTKGKMLHINLNDTTSLDVYIRGEKVRILSIFTLI